MSISNEEYLQALEKTKNIYGNTAVGFISEGSSTSQGFKQSNTIIQLIIQLGTKLGVIQAKLEELDTRLKGIETKVGAPSSSGVSKAIEDLTQKVSKLNTGATSKVTQEKGTLKVQKNPFELLRKIQ